MTLLATVMALSFFWTATIAQSTGGTVAEIREKYRNVKANVDSYDTTMMDMWDESTEGGHAIAYYDNNSDLKLIQAIWFGETGKKMTEYYFDKGKLIFAFDQNFAYNRPIYWDKERAEETGDVEVFDPMKTTVREDRYYFENEKLFIWLDNEGKEVDLRLSSNAFVGSGLINHAIKMRDELRK